MEKGEQQLRISKGMLEDREGREDREDIKRYKPIPEYEGKSFQMDSYGNFRIVMNTIKGKIESGWVPYEGIATIDIDAGMLCFVSDYLGDHQFIGVSDYYKGCLPTEQILRIEKVDEDGESSFYKIKVTDIVEDKILGQNEILEILRDPPFDVEEYGFVVKPVIQKDFVKVRITELGNFYDRFLSREEFIDYIVDTFSAERFDVCDENGNIVNK